MQISRRKLREAPGEPPEGWQSVPVAAHHPNKELDASKRPCIS